VFAAVLGSVAAFVAVVDPYNRFHEAKARVILGGRTNLPLQTFISVNKLPAAKVRATDVVILGDSRADKLTRSDLEKIKGQAVLNLGIGGVSFEEMLSAYEWRPRSFSALKQVVVTVPLERLAQAPLPDRCREACPLADSALRYVLNWDIFVQSWRISAARKNPTALGTAELSNASALSEGNGNSSAAIAASMRNEWKRMYDAYDRPRAERRLETLRNFVAAINAQGAKVTLWLPPLHKEIRDLMARSRLGPDRDRLLSALRSIAPTVDLTEASGLNGNDFTFTDPVHTADGAVILNLLLSAGSRSEQSGWSETGQNTPQSVMK
jgi:hypothetical protein